MSYFCAPQFQMTMQSQFYTTLLLLITLFIPSENFAQQLTKVRDLGVWTGAEIDYEFRKNCSISFMQDLRLFENFTKIQEANSDLGFDYKINKNFKIGTNARYSYNLKSADYYSHDFRMNYDFQFKTKLGENFRLRYRLRFQQTYENLLTLERYKVGGKESNLRNKLEFGYEIKSHEIYFSTEIFRKIEVYTRPHFNKLRFILGSKWENKLGVLNYAIAYERDLREPNPLHYVFAKAYYTFEFERKNPKKKKKKKDAK